jgi:hypothetical protein
VVYYLEITTFVGKYNLIQSEMKKIRFKKTIWFTVITTLCLVVITLFAAVGCDKSEIPPTNYTNGTIVGYTKCNANSDGALIGLFIITEKKDFLLSFNAPLASICIDSNSLKYGVYGMNENVINFDYRIAIGEEIKQMVDFLCPQNAMEMSFLHGPIENYTQIIITDIK